MSKQPIVILGSGIGGLTLARYLRQKGISSIIYDRVTSSPRHSYGITLYRWAYKPLLQVLGIDENSFRRRTAVNSLYHAGTGKVYPEGSTLSRDLSPGTFRANRSKLERLLKEGQEIHQEHALRDAKASLEGGCTNLIFQNDVEVNSSFIVDTLGVHSQLRKSLLPQYSLNILPFVVFSGKRNVRQDTFREIYAPHLEDASILQLKPEKHEDVLLQIWVNDHILGGDVDISYVYSRPARSKAPDLLHNPDRPMAGATDIPEAFYDELESLLTDSELKEPFLSTFDPQKIRRERLLHWLMRSVLVTADDLAKLAENGVVMVGDSAHAAPILGGKGANHAIQDAIELAEVISASSSDALELDKAAIRDFYDRCASRWRKEVQDSEHSIAQMHSVEKAVS